MFVIIGLVDKLLKLLDSLRLKVFKQREFQTTSSGIGERRKIRTP
jgi:hypothetical protein